MDNTTIYHNLPALTQNLELIVKIDPNNSEKARKKVKEEIYNAKKTSEKIKRSADRKREYFKKRTEYESSFEEKQIQKIARQIIHTYQKCTSIAGLKIIHFLFFVKTDDNVQKRAQSLLGKTGTNATEVFINVFSDENVSTRIWAIKALGEIGSKRATKPLLDILKEDKAEVYLNTIKASVKIGDTRAIK